MSRGAAAKEQDKLLRFLNAQRWFGEKGRELRVARIADRVPVRWPDSEARFWVARLRVEDEHGEAHYQVFLREGADALEDALGDATFQRGLVAAFAAGATFQGDGVRWVIQSESGATFKEPAGAVIQLSRAEQTNSSLMIGTHAVLKLFRRIAPGVHPDLEIARFLTIDRRFLHTPALLGSIHFVDERGTWAAGLLHEMVPGATDAWSHALTVCRPWFASGGAPDRKGKEERIPFVLEAERLGVVTRAMHDALASGEPGSAFEVRAASERDVEGWAEAARVTIRRALDSLQQASDRSAIPGEIAAKVMQRRRELEGWPARVASRVSSDAGSRMRVHGDYHLGQVLRSITNEFLVIDFEGEPSRSLDERRQPQSPLRDVAGMLRSFSYLGARLDGELGDGKGERSSLSARWERAVREAFLGGYFGGEGEAENRDRNVLPASRRNADELISLFEAEKTFYELQYEIDHRPDWVWIPLGAILAMRT